MKTIEEVRHVFYLCRVWGSRHGGSIYGKALVEAVLRKSWAVTLVAEEFLDGKDLSAPGGTPGGPAGETPAVTCGGAAGPERSQPQCVRLEAFFKRDVLLWPRRLAEVLKLWNRITRTPGALVIVQGDLPRLTYVLLQGRVPLMFVRQDGILTCPGNNRFLERSRIVCRKPLGLSCLLVHRKEGCLGPLSVPRQIGRLVFRVRDGLLLRCIDNFVANSRYIARAHGKPQRALYPPRLSASASRSFPERNLKRLVFCGRLEPVKGARDALGILRLLPDSFGLEIVGDGPDRGPLARAVADLRLEERVMLHGWLGRAQRDAVMASAGVLLMPSLWDEAFGMAGLEAFAQGTPVVAYDVGGISEWSASGAGLLVPCGDLRRAAAAVRELTDDATRWAIHSQAALRVAELEFPVTRFGRELDEVLRRVLEKWSQQ